MYPSMLKIVGGGTPVCRKADKEYHLKDVRNEIISSHVTHLLSAGDVIYNSGSGSGGKSSGWCKLCKFGSDGRVGNCGGVMPQTESAHRSPTAEHVSYKNGQGE